MMMGNESTAINNDLNKSPVALYDYGAMWTNGTMAVAIINGRLAIANSKRSNGDWLWTTVMDGGKVLVGEVFTGALHTNEVDIVCEDEEIDGHILIQKNLITIADNIVYNNQTEKYEKASSAKNKMRIGYDDELDKYVFEIYDNSGKEKTIYLDGATGDAVFKGKVTSSEIEGSEINGTNIVGGTIIGTEVKSNSKINVNTDATIGRYLYLQSGYGTPGVSYGTIGDKYVRSGDGAGGMVEIGNSLNVVSNLTVNYNPVVTSSMGQNISLRINENRLAVYLGGNYIGFISLN